MRCEDETVVWDVSVSKCGIWNCWRGEEMVLSLLFRRCGEYVRQDFTKKGLSCSVVVIVQSGFDEEREYE
jgi:hypothetical protein